MKSPASEFSIEEDPFFAEDLRQMAKAVNYRRWQFNMVAPFVRGKVLEVGGGIGNFTVDLAGVAESLMSIEPNQYCFGQLTERTKALRNVTVLNVTAEALLANLPPGYLADSLVCMNVLEHIQDDRASVQTFARLLKPGGTVAILVPAVPSAFGEIDQRLGHYRRYSRKGLANLIAESGFEVTKVCYFNFVGLWAWWWNARFARRSNQSDAQIRFFDTYLVPILSRIESVLPVPIGQSLLVTGTKARNSSP
jgi:SAM-dependent methyltransferase